MKEKLKKALVILAGLVVIVNGFVACRGEMVEFNDTKTMFSYPEDKRTEDYITGRFG